MRLLYLLFIIPAALLAQTVDTAPRSPVVLASDPNCTRVGTFYAKTDGTLRRCTATGTPGTWADISGGTADIGNCTYSSETQAITCPGGFSGGDGTAPGEIQLPETSANGTNYISLKAPNAIDNTLTLVFPNANPLNGQALVFTAPTAGVSTGSWITPATGSAQTLDPTVLFFESVAADTSAWGKFGGGSCSAMAAAAATATQPSGVKIDTTAASTMTCFLSLNGGTAARLPNLGSTSTLTSWEFQMVAGVDATSVATSEYFVGLNLGGQTVLNDRIGLHYKNDGAAGLTCAQGDTAPVKENWVFEVVTYSGGHTVCDDTGVAVTNGHTYRVKATSSTMGTILFELFDNGVSAATATLNQWVPTSSLYPAALVSNLTTSNSRTVTAYYLGYKLVGIVR